MIDLIGAFPHSVAHAQIRELFEIAVFVEGFPRLRFHDERCATPANQVQQAHLLDFRVVKPKRAGPAAPATEIKVGFAMLKRIEDNVLCGPVLVRLHAQMVVIQGAIAGEQEGLR